MVGEFENMTGDRSLDSLGNMVAQAISQGLVELGGVEVVSAPPPSGGGAGRPGDAALRVAARAAGAGTLVSGSYYLSGGTLELRGRVSDVESGKLVYALKPETGPRGAPAEAVDRVRQRVMGATILHLGDAFALGGLKTPPLYSAYQEYLAGMRSMGVDAKAVIPHLERAGAIDPEFWRPQILLLSSYRGVGDVGKYEALKKHLQDSQDQFGPAELILFQYMEANLAGLPLEAYRKAREVLALAPGDVGPLFAAANLAVSLNRPREALACIGDVEKLDWKTLGHWVQGPGLLRVVAFAHHLVGEYEAELAVAEFALRLYPDSLIVRRDQVRALAGLGRVAEVDRVVTESLAIRGRGATPGHVMLAAAQELRAHGHADASRRVAAQGAGWFAALTGEEASSLQVQQTRIECLWLAERFDEARTVADRLAKAFPQDLWALGFRGILAARAGDRQVAEAVDRQLAGLDAAQSAGEPTYLRACIAAQRGERDRAVELLRGSMARGFAFVNYLHTYTFLEPLHGYPPFEELIKPQA